MKTLKDLVLISLFLVITTVLVWLPHMLAVSNFWGLNFSQGFATIYKNFDGLEYIIIAKTWYQPDMIARIPQDLPANYFAAHFPGYPILIALFAPLLGFLKSMVFVSLLFTTLAAGAFYFLVRDFKLTNNPFLLTLIFLILPARWVIVRSVGSAEPIFIFFVIACIYFFLKTLAQGDLPARFIWLSAAMASLAQLTRPPGALLGLALAIFVLWQSWQKKSVKYLLSFYPFLLVPLTLVGVFYWYSITYQDFLAYFHSGDNIHLFFPPFSIFNASQYWVGTMWLEDIIYIFILGLFGVVFLFKQKLYPLGLFVLTYLTASMFVAHRDISRYTLPAVPFILIAYQKILTSKEFQLVLLILWVAIYLYAQNFILENTAPIADLSIYN